MKHLDSLRKLNANRSTKSRTHKEKKLLIQKFIKEKSRENEDKHEKLELKVDELAGVRKHHIDVLQKFIFLVEEVTPPSALETNMAVSTVSALRDATHTTYIGGKWVYTSSLEDGNYRIIEPTLPSSGDYTAYNLWVATSRENGGNPDNSLRNPGHTISGALALTSQLLSVLSFILDVRLPWKQSYSVFCGSEMAEKQFKDAVARLNQNILYLCFSQGVQEYHQLETKNTLQNILYLLQCPTFGRSIPVLISESLLHSFEEITVTEECNRFSVAMDEDQEVEGDWEQVSEDLTDIDVPTSRAFYSMTSDAPSMDYQGRQSESAIGLVSSAAASVFSIFKPNRR